MDRVLYQKISDWFDAHQADMVEDIMRLVRHGSVSEPQSDVKPFGLACRNCMDEMLQIGREHGFYTENYEYYVGSIGSEIKNWDNMIGFWNHMDVVPVGNDWDYEPFDPVLKGHFLIGRGSQDNKGPAIGILYMMQCLRELGIDLKHELCLFVGSDEESGMDDMRYYTENYPTPRLSVIADSGFPVCYGEKGIIEGRMVFTKIPAGLVQCGGGHAGNMIPDAAYADLRKTDALLQELETYFAKGEERAKVKSEDKDSVIRITAFGTSKHSAFPEGSVNAIYQLSKFISSLNTVEVEVRELFRKIAYLSEEYYGENLGIAYRDEVSGPTTCAATILKCEEGAVTLHFNIRYSITANAEDILNKLNESAGKLRTPAQEVQAQGMQTQKTQAQGMQAPEIYWELERDSAPNYFPKDHPAVSLLTAVYNEITGENKESFVMGGGTYARKLPNAFAYGIGGMKESDEDRKWKAELFRPGHGGAHEPDEALNVRLLLEAMKIYTMAIIAMNDIDI